MSKRLPKLKAEEEEKADENSSSEDENKNLEDVEKKVLFEEQDIQSQCNIFFYKICIFYKNIKNNKNLKNIICF